VPTNSRTFVVDIATQFGTEKRELQDLKSWRTKVSQLGQIAERMQLGLFAACVQGL